MTKITYQLWALDLFTPQARTVSNAAGAWRNPSELLRAGVTAAVWAVPGMLVGLMAVVVLPVAVHPAVACAAGGLLGAVAGAWLERSS